MIWGAICLLGGLLMGIFLHGCATGSVAMQPGQEKAVWIVWVQVYGRPDAPPAIKWVTDLPCTDKASDRPGFYVIPSPEDLTDDDRDHGTCREGFTYRWDQVSVALHPGDKPSTTVMAHELLHAALWRQGIVFGHHRRPDFYPLIDEANAALSAAGQ